MKWTSRIRFWQNWEFFSSVSWQTFELIKTRSCGVQTPTYPTDFHHRWWRLRHTKVRASTKAAGWGFHSEVRVLCEVLGCGFLHLRNLHEELILGSNIVVGSRCSCVAGGVRINRPLGSRTTESYTTRSVTLRPINGGEGKRWGGTGCVCYNVRPCWERPKRSKTSENMINLVKKIRPYMCRCQPLKGYELLLIFETKTRRT